MLYKNRFDHIFPVMYLVRQVYGERSPQTEHACRPDLESSVVLSCRKCCLKMHRKENGHDPCLGPCDLNLVSASLTAL